jgi:hypothetical protein
MGTHNRVADRSELSWNGGRDRVTAPYDLCDARGVTRSSEGWISFVKDAGNDCED